MWKLEIRPSAIAWMLGLLFAVGLVSRAVDWIRPDRGGGIRIVTRRDSTLFARADSIFHALKERQNSPLDVNRAGAADFERLPGIGPVLAGNIIAHREERGPFTTLDQLLDVSGIGEKRLAAIRDLCFVDSADVLQITP